MGFRLLVGVGVLAVVLAGCGSWEETLAEGRDLIDDTMEEVFPGTEYVVRTGPVICEFTDGEHYVFIRAEFELSVDPQEAVAAVASYWEGREDTKNIGAGDDSAGGNADGSVIGFLARSNGVGSIDVKGGPCRKGTTPATSIVVTPG